MPVINTEKDPSRLALLWAHSAAKAFAKFKELNESGEAPNTDNLRGLLDGLARRTIPHPLPGVPAIRPEMGLQYVRGYDSGEAFAKAAEVFTDPEVVGRWIEPLKNSQEFS